MNLSGFPSARAFLREKTVFVASFVERRKSARKATLGTLPYLYDYLKSNASEVVWLEQPLPGSEDITPTVEIARATVQQRRVVLSAMKLMASRRTDSSKTYVTLKVRDLMSVILTALSLPGKIDLFIGVEAVNALMGIILRWTGKVDKSVYYVINYNAPKRYPDRGPLPNTLFLALDRFCAIRSDFVWNQAEVVKQIRARVGLDPLRTAPQLTVPMPIRQLVRKIDIQSGSDVIYVGTIHEYFGVDLIVDAIPLIAKNLPRFRCHFVGDGPARHRLEEKIRSCSLEQNAIFHGYLPQPETDKIMTTCRAGLAPYPLYDPRNRKVPTGHVFTDVGKPKIYVSMGLPVIMTTGIPFSDEVKRYHAGIVIDYDPYQLADATTTLLQDETLYKRCREGAIELAKQYDATHILDRVFAEMDSLQKAQR